MDASKLEGPALDLAVMLADGWKQAPVEPGDDFACGATWKLVRPGVMQPFCWECQPQAFSTAWEVGGQLIERERIDLSAPHGSEPYWCAHMPSSACWGHGPTPLIAAMRAFVASKAT